MSLPHHRVNWLSVLLIATTFTFLLANPSTATAQYKNINFGFDGGYDYILTTSVADSTGVLLAASQRPLHLSYGGRIGAYLGFKLSHDHWWFMVRLNGKIYNFYPKGDPAGSIDQIFDNEANLTLGTLFGLEPVLGVRYYILTDYNRPFIGFDVSYMHLFSFTSTQSSSCGNVLLSCDGFSNSQTFLPQSNLLAFHLNPGVEFIFHHDVAFTLGIDVARWLVFGIPGNWMFGLTAGFTFYG